MDNRNYFVCFRYIHHSLLSANAFRHESRYNAPLQSVEDNSNKWKNHSRRKYRDGVQQRQPVQRPAPVTWMSLPRKGQLALLGLCRVFDFLQISSLQAYMFFQLKSFDESLTDSEISTQAGILQGAFTAAQFATAVAWGQVADAQWGGRKFVLLVGLLGTAVSCLGAAFSTSFEQAGFLAVLWRSDQRDGRHHSNYDLRECQGEEVPFAGFFDIAYWLQHCCSVRTRWVVKI